MALTQEGLLAHIVNIQCKSKELSKTYINKLKVGKICKEAELNLLIIEEYLKVLRSYKISDYPDIEIENCLNEKEICSIISNSYKLTNDCNC